MILIAEEVKTVYELSTVEITGDTTSASREITNISAGDIATLEIGMKVVHSNLQSRSKIIDIGVDKIVIDKPALSTGSGETISAGKGLDICFREIENEIGETLERWKYLDTVEDLMNQYPSISLLGYEINTDNLEDEAPDLKGWDFWSIDNWIVNTGNDVKAVNYWVQYCRDAIKRLVDLDQSFGCRFETVKLINADLSDMYQIKETHDYLQILVQTIEIKVVCMY